MFVSGVVSPIQGINWTKEKNRGQELWHTSRSGPNRLLSICDFDANNNTNSICIVKPREICGHICSQYAERAGRRDGVNTASKCYHACIIAVKRFKPPPPRDHSEAWKRRWQAGSRPFSSGCSSSAWRVRVGAGEEEHLHHQHKVKKGQWEGSVIICASDQSLLKKKIENRRITGRVWLTQIQTQQAWS